MSEAITHRASVYIPWTPSELVKGNKAPVESFNGSLTAVRMASIQMLQSLAKEAGIDPINLKEETDEWLTEVFILNSDGENSGFSVTIVKFF